MQFDKSRQLQKTAHQLIPGGCHTYAKGDDQFPLESPGFIARGKGCHVWDVDGNEFIEYGSGLRSVTLGHAYDSVVEAAHRQMLLGNNYSRPAPVEVACAEKLLSFIPAAEQVKFAKDGSTVTTAAVKLARAHTGRDRVALCSDHPFFSYNDWFIATTDVDSGVGVSSREEALLFRYNDAASLDALFDAYPDEIACVILEPARNEEPENGFLESVRDICTRRGAILVFDEMITGFRLHNGGGQAYFGVTPDLSAWGKALANGFSLSALAGRRDLMEVGGLFHSRERVFLLSTTHGAENHSLAAAIATMEVYETEDVVGTLARQGERLRSGVNQVIQASGLGDHFSVQGMASNMYFVTRDPEGVSSQPYRTLFLQELIRRGVIAPSFVVNYSHADEDIDRTVEACAGALQVYKAALENGIEGYLVGDSVKPVYRRYN